MVDHYEKKTPFWRCFYFFPGIKHANPSFVSLKSKKVTQNNSNAIQALKFQKFVTDQKILPLFNHCLTKALGHVVEVHLANMATSFCGC